MSAALTWSSRLQRSLLADDGVTRLSLTMGEPPVISTEPDGHLALALTPTATTVFIAVDGPVDVTGASVRLTSQVGLTAPAYADLRHLRVWARRKPDTSGAIAVQVIKFGKGDGTTLGDEIGRISVLAEAAGTTDPVSDVFDQTFVAGHVNFALGTSDGFQIDLSSIDTDLEIVIEMHWIKP